MSKHLQQQSEAAADAQRARLESRARASAEYIETALEERLGAFEAERVAAAEETSRLKQALSKEVAAASELKVEIGRRSATSESELKEAREEERSRTRQSAGPSGLGSRRVFSRRRARGVVHIRRVFVCVHDSLWASSRRGFPVGLRSCGWTGKGIRKGCAACPNVQVYAPTTSALGSSCRIHRANLTPHLPQRKPKPGLSRRGASNM